MEWITQLDLLIQMVWFVHDYQLDKDNVVKFVNKTDSETDELYPSKKDGTIDRSKSPVSLKKGTLKIDDNGTLINKVQTKDGKTKGFQTSNVQDAQKVFKFASDYSTFESGNPNEFTIITSEKNGTSNATVVTDGSPDGVGGNIMAKELSENGESVKTMRHNHPGGNPPSGYVGDKLSGVPGKNEGDRKVYNGGIKSSVYSAQKQLNYMYDEKGYYGIPLSVEF